MARARAGPPERRRAAGAALALLLAAVALASQAPRGAGAAEAPKTRVCLVTVVKNEAGQLRRMLESAAPHITGWCVCDTGSTDGTQELVTSFFDEKGIPGRLASHPWKNFGKNRNMCLEEAAEKLMASPGCDFFMLLDADHEAVPARPGYTLKSADLSAQPWQSYHLLERPPPGRGGWEYENLRLVRANRKWEYSGATHEYIHAADGGPELAGPRPPLDLIHYADGGNRGDKFERDRRLLEEAAIEDPKDPRTRFYLANTYRDLGMCNEAIEQYRERAALGGWQEEVYLSHLEEGKCQERLGNSDAASAAYEAAWAANALRQEAPHRLARLARLKDDHPAAYRWAKAATSLGPAPEGSLFVEGNVYKIGSLDELCISAYYVDALSEGEAACRDLISRVEAEAAAAAAAGARLALEYTEALERTRSNLGFYESAASGEASQLAGAGLECNECYSGTPVHRAAPWALHPQALSPRSAAVVHVAFADDITIRGIHAASLAKQQVTAAGGYYRFLYVVHPGSLRAQNPPTPWPRIATLEVLRQVLGAQFVAAIEAGDVAESLGVDLLREQVKAMGMAGAQGDGWARATADSAYVAWYLRARANGDVPDWVTELWFLRLGVGWTGDLPDALAAISPPCGADLVSYDIRKARPSWPWLRARNWLADGEVWRSFPAAARLSSRLLAAVGEEMAAGHAQHEDATAASICMKARAWCRADPCFGPGHRSIGRHPESGAQAFQWDSEVGPAAWGDVVRRCEARAAAAEARGRARPPGKLYYQLKF